MTASTLMVTPLAGLPQVRAGDDLVELLWRALLEIGLRPVPFDILVVTQKIVSKAEGRYLELASLTPSPRALELSAVTGKDPRLVEAVLSQSVEVVRAKTNVLIVETRQGLVMANAGIDQSNLERGSEGGRVLLLPEDPDASAARLAFGLGQRAGCELAVIVSDSSGRAWRLGTVGMAIGAAGLPSLWDRRGEPDMAGRPLEVTEVAFADAIAAAAVIAMGEAAEGTPAALVRGLTWSAKTVPAKNLQRPRSMDMFR